MESQIARAIKLKNSPVAVLWTDRKPEGALQFEEGKWGCVVSMLNAAAHGKTVVFDEKTCGCGGGAAGLGFRKYELGFIEYFLSTGGVGDRESEHYKKNPDYAREFIKNIPDVPVPTRYVVFKPLGELAADEIPEAVVFLVNPDQLSGLVTLANYDRPTKDNVTIFFGAGCHSSVLEVIAQGRAENPKALIGLTDPSARRFIDPNLLSFGVPYQQFLEMESQVEESFLTKHTWEGIAKRM